MYLWTDFFRFTIYHRLFKSPPLLLILIGEQHRKMEQKYPEGGHCQCELHLQGILMSPLFSINSVEIAAPFNFVSNPWDTVLLACYLDRIAQILQLSLDRQCWSFSKFVRRQVARQCVNNFTVLFYQIFGKVLMHSWSVGAIGTLVYVQTNSTSLSCI